MNEYEGIILEIQWNEIFYHQFVRYYVDKIDWSRLSWNANISMAIINNHPEHSWD